MSFSSRKRAIKLILDWDGTLTFKDTLALVAKIGYDKQGLPLNDPGDYPPPATSWDVVGSKYLDRYNHHKLHYRPSSQQRLTLAEERAWLASLKPIEVFGAQSAESTRVFRGVTRHDIETAAQAAIANHDVALRPGWIDLAAYVLSNGSLSILSVNWSATFIREALLASLRTHKSEAINAGLINYFETKLCINANEIQGFDLVGGSSGCLRSKDEVDEVRTSADKLSRLSEGCQPSSDGKKSIRKPDEALVVYCGDSDTDLECLLAADVGICLQDEYLGTAQKALADTLQRLRVRTEPIEQFSPLNQPGVCLWIARDFWQVLTAFRGFDGAE